MTHAQQLWAIVGATGTGKSALSLDLAEHLTLTTGKEAEIVNADAMQLYRGMNIGTAKLAVSERRGIEHHLLDVCDVTEEASVAWYQTQARAVIRGIFDRNNIPILVGGSGLYVSSVLYEFQFPPRDETLRAALESEAAEHGSDPLFLRLQQLAPVVAAQVDQRNPRRVIRALEVALLGEDASATLPERPNTWHADTSVIGLHCDRDVLVERLDRRVESMWHQGLLDEVGQLRERGLEEGKTARQAIGYAQALAQLRGELTEADAIETTQALTRKYARRQVSWFKRYENVQHIDTTNGLGPSEIAALN